MTLGHTRTGRRDALLELARRLAGAAPRPRPDTQRTLRPSGKISFDEFMLQYPCEIELPADLADRAFIEVAYRAILLRAAEPVEIEQHLKLLQEGVASQVSIVEDLLASAELRALERRVRVVLGGMVIVDPERPDARRMPAVAWPWRLAD